MPVLTTRRVAYLADRQLLGACVEQTATSWTGSQWIHVLLPVLLAALRTLGDAPARSLTALAQRLGVSEADAAPVVVPLEEEPALVATPDAPCYVNRSISRGL
jgi:hypothetical protein